MKIDPNYPKAVVTTHLLEHHWCLYHQEWNVVWNNTDEPFVTSDNPSCFDYEYGGPIHAARYLPLTPRLALWTQPDKLPERGSDAPPARRSLGREATAKFVRDMNRLIVQSAENIVLSSKARPYISAWVEKYKNWRVRSSEVIRIPTADGHYELIQTRASPQT